MYSTSESIYEILDELYAAGKTAEVEEFLLEVLHMNQPYCGIMNSAYITVLYELGVYFRRTGKLLRSLDWFMLLRGIVYDHLGPDSFEYAVVIENIAATFEMAGEYDKALHYYLQTLHIYKHEIDMQKSRYIDVLENICRLYNALKDYKAAMVYHENLISILNGQQDAAYENGGFIDLCRRAGLRDRAQAYAHKYDGPQKLTLN